MEFDDVCSWWMVFLDGLRNVYSWRERDFRLPGLGSYLQKAADEGNEVAIIWGLATMITVIIVLDSLIWRPLIAWSDKFKIEQVESETKPKSRVLNLIQRSKILVQLKKHLLSPLGERLTLLYSRRERNKKTSNKGTKSRKLLANLISLTVFVLIGYGLWSALKVFLLLGVDDLLIHFKAR